MVAGGGCYPATEDFGRCGSERRERAVTDTLKICMNCERPLADRVEEEERTGTGASRSTGRCATYRVWFCVNPECVMLNTDLYREQIADQT